MIRLKTLMLRRASSRRSEICSASGIRDQAEIAAPITARIINTKDTPAALTAAS